MWQVNLHTVVELCVPIILWGFFFFPTVSHCNQMDAAYRTNLSNRRYIIKTFLFFFFFFFNSFRWPSSFPFQFMCVCRRGSSGYVVNTFFSPFCCLLCHAEYCFRRQFVCIASQETGIGPLVVSSATGANLAKSQ